MKIISTISPLSIELSSIIKDSDIIRITNSHLNKEWFERIYLENKDVFPDIFLDLQGPKIRVSSIFDKEIKFINNERFYFCSEEYYINNNLNFRRNYIPLNIKKDISFLTDSTNILVDQKSNFSLTEIVNKNCFQVKVHGSAILRKEKGINFIGIDRDLPIPVKDLEDLKELLKYRPKYVCYSFVESQRQILELKKYLKDYPDTKIISKIESQKGIENILEIINVSDGILIGRGDLSREILLQLIPKVQDLLINICIENNKLIYVGTNILETMIKNPYPSISELMALEYFKNKKIDGVMLSDETCRGSHPLKCIEICKDIIKGN